MHSDVPNAEADELILWPDTPPGTHATSVVPHIEQTADGRLISHIMQPVLHCFRPAQANGTACLVIPGGGYTKLVFDKEGTELARWLTRHGISAYVLQHRLPCEGHHNGHLVPMQDAQRALRLIRSQAASHGLRTDRIGVLGASSGAHLAASLACTFATNAYPASDAIDTLSARPDFFAGLYGPYTGNRFFNPFSPEQLFFPEAEKNRLYAQFRTHELVSAQTPPSFLVMADDDQQVNPENTTALYLALKRAKVPAELHLYHDGKHGFALTRQAPTCVATWPEQCLQWLATRGFV